MFQKDDYVFYESGGICQISDIQKAPLDSMPSDRLYYVMQSLHDRNSVMYIPVDNDRIFVRKLLNREEASSLVKQIAAVEAIEESNSKLLRTKYIEAMRTHDPIEWVRVIKTVYHRANNCTTRTQRLSETERSFAETAKRYLYTELALALEMKEYEMEDYITSCIQMAE
ncbi:MAG: hypothetical protein IJX28_03440 [Clostridia bacterium]|nr:hypothetical protein [Clostridia bacterium]